MRRLLQGGVAAVVLLAACGGGDDPSPDVGTETTEAVDPGAGGAVTAASDRRVQSNLRNVFVAEQVHYTDHQVYTESLADLRAIEPALTYAMGAQPTTAGTVYIRLVGDALYLSGKSGTGTCFYLRGSAAGGRPTYASDAACGAADAQHYGPSW